VNAKPSFVTVNTQIKYVQSKEEFILECSAGQNSTQLEVIIANVDTAVPITITADQTNVKRVRSALYTVYIPDGMVYELPDVHQGRVFDINTFEMIRDVQDNRLYSGKYYVMLTRRSLNYNFTPKIKSAKEGTDIGAVKGYWNISPPKGQCHVIKTEYFVPVRHCRSAISARGSNFTAVCEPCTVFNQYIDTFGPIVTAPLLSAEDGTSYPITNNWTVYTWPSQKVSSMVIADFGTNNSDDLPNFGANDALMISVATLRRNIKNTKLVYTAEQTALLGVRHSKSSAVSSFKTTFVQAKSM